MVGNWRMRQVPTRGTIGASLAGRGLRYRWPIALVELFQTYSRFHLVMQCQAGLNE